LPGQDVQMVMLSTAGARPVSAVGDSSSKGGAGKGGTGETGTRDVEVGLYGDGADGSGSGSGSGGAEGVYDGYAVVAVAVAVTVDDASSMLGASAPPLVDAITK
jgi:hypothetical protein